MNPPPALGSSVVYGRRPPVGHAEEVTHRHLDARHLAAVPVHPQDRVAQGLRRAVGNSDPDVPDHAATIDVHQRDGLAVGDFRNAGRALASAALLAAGTNSPGAVLPRDRPAGDAVGYDRQELAVERHQSEIHRRATAKRNQHEDRYRKKQSNRPSHVRSPFVFSANLVLIIIRRDVSDRVRAEHSGSGRRVLRLRQHDG